MTPQSALFAGLIDYAGLFPPAALEMPAAVRQYASYRRGPHAWMLGRFIVPLARLPEIEAAAGWKFGVLTLPGDVLPPSVDSVEIKIERAEDIRRLSRRLPAQRYFEIPIAADPDDLIAALAETGSRAKVRTGGLTPEAYPTPADLARFLHAAANLHVPFKATAGLHHPIGAPPQFGFVNVFLAAALAHHGGTRRDLADILEETSPDAFRWDGNAVAWRSHRLSTDQLLAARDEFAISFGSCSFEEPIADLQALGWL